MDYSERRMRAEISKIPDGRYVFEDYMEDDGIEDKPYKIRAEVVVQGADMVVDYHGIVAAGEGPDQRDARRGLERRLRRGPAADRLLDPKELRLLPPDPGACSAGHGRQRRISPDLRSAAIPRLTAASLTRCMGALAPALKDRSAATDGASHSNFLFGGTDKKTGEFFCCYDLTPVGWGARSFADGNDAVCAINGNCPHIPVEVFENRFPWHVEEFRLVDGSGGPGKFRGGMSLTKTVRCTNTDMTFSYMADRQKIAPWGIHGGLPGGKAELLFKRNGSDEWLTISQAFNKPSPSKFANVPVHPGDSSNCRPGRRRMGTAEGTRPRALGRGRARGQGANRAGARNLRLYRGFNLKRFQLISELDAGAVPAGTAALPVALLDFRRHQPGAPLPSGRSLTRVIGIMPPAVVERNASFASDKSSACRFRCLCIRRPVPRRDRKPCAG